MDDFTIATSKLHGNGVFANRAFGKGHVLIKLDGKIMTGEEASKLSIEQFNNLLQIDNNKYLDLSNKTHFFLNHSCSPNAYIRVISNFAFILSLIPINIGDEITYEYSLVSTANKTILNCNCNNYGCRKIISGYSSLPASIQEKYLSFGVVPSFVKQ